MSKIFSGKTVDEAVNAGLIELGLTKEQVEILVLEQGSKGFLGLGAKPAKVQLLSKEAINEAKAAEKAEEKTLTEEKPERRESAPRAEKQPKREPKQHKQEKKTERHAEQTESETVTINLTPIENPTNDAVAAKEFLAGLIKILEIEGTVDVVDESSERVVFNVVTADSSNAIGYRGEVLDSFQTLAGAVYNTNKEKYSRVVVDCENYRAKREKTLNALARKLASKAVASGRKITLEPMNPFERRVIHSALMDYEGVKTISEGKEPNRFVAIIPDNYDPSKARTRSGFRGKDGARGFHGRSGRYDRSSSEVKSAPKAKTSAFSGGVFLGNSLKDNKPESEE